MCWRCAACRGRACFDDIDLDVRAGEILGICGMAGSGRTELLRALIGADPARAAPVRSARTRTRGLPTRAQAIAAGHRAAAGRPQDRRLLPAAERRLQHHHLAARRIQPRRSCSAKRGERDVVAGLVRRLGIRTPGTDAASRNLSGGNQQKCLIARSLNAALRHPADRRADARRRRRRQARDLPAARRPRRRASGAAIVIVSSELPEILGLCDRILVMRDGRDRRPLRAARKRPRKC